MLLMSFVDGEPSEGGGELDVNSFFGGGGESDEGELDCGGGVGELIFLGRTV
jgi:hypothetical protein